MGGDLTVWTIYAHPLDYPNGYVVAEWITDGTGPKRGTALYAPDLDAARKLIPPNLYRMNRSPDDDPTIAETWL
jgi:hypothetical protein